MRILEVSPYVDPKRGGQEKHVLALSKALSRLGHVVTVAACGYYDSRFIEDLEFVKIDSKQVLGLCFISGDKLIDFISTNKFDICHLHHATLFGETVLTINKICNLPTVTTLHSLMLRNLPARFLYDRISLRIVSKLSNKVICLSQNIMLDLIRRGLERPKCVVIPNAIDVQFLGDQFRKIHDELEPNFDLLFVGRLERRKGIHWLLESLSLLHNQGKRYTLRIVGRGPLEQEVRDMIFSKNLGGYVTLFGYIPENELLECYSLARCVVIPSLYEGVPTVALEAIAAGKPLIVSDIPGLNELVMHERNGLLITPMDIQGLSSAIERILSSSNYLVSPADANREILARFDWEVVARKIIETYRRSLNCI
jgi:glycosyltransferase involved in cell wall biosynthesis